MTDEFSHFFKCMTKRQNPLCVCFTALRRKFYSSAEEIILLSIGFSGQNESKIAFVVLILPLHFLIIIKICNFVPKLIYNI